MCQIPENWLIFGRSSLFTSCSSVLLRVLWRGFCYGSRSNCHYSHIMTCRYFNGQYVLKFYNQVMYPFLSFLYVLKLCILLHYSVSGACSCLDGYKGKYCDTECDSGFFGHACENKCQCNTENSERCDQVKGTCFCLPGYQGETCEEVRLCYMLIIFSQSGLQQYFYDKHNFFKWEFALSSIHKLRIF